MYYKLKMNYLSMVFYFFEANISGKINKRGLCNKKTSMCNSSETKYD